MNNNLTDLFTVDEENKTINFEIGYDDELEAVKQYIDTLPVDDFRKEEGVMLVNELIYRIKKTMVGKAAISIIAASGKSESVTILQAEDNELNIEQ